MSQRITRLASYPSGRAVVPINTKQKPNILIAIRNATLTDLPAIVDIYNQSIPAGKATADTRPITVEERLQWFEQFDAKTRPIWVAERNEEILGCIYITSFYGGRPAYDKTAEVSLYLSDTAQKQGLGTYDFEQLNAKKVVL